MSCASVSLRSVVKHFAVLPDPRHQRNRRHLLVDVISIAVCGVIVGCDGPTAIAIWAKAKQDWLKKLLELSEGIDKGCILWHKTLWIKGFVSRKEAALMTTECNAESFLFQSLGRPEVVARFDGGTITSDAGALLLRETERITGIVRQSAFCRHLATAGADGGEVAVRGGVLRPRGHGEPHQGATTVPLRGSHQFYRDAGQ